MITSVITFDMALVYKTKCTWSAVNKDFNTCALKKWILCLLSTLLLHRLWQMIHFILCNWKEEKKLSIKIVLQNDIKFIWKRIHDYKAPPFFTTCFKYNKFKKKTIIKWMYFVSVCMLRLMFVLVNLTVHLYFLFFQGDIQAVQRGKGKMGDRLEKAADLIMGCFRVCASDKYEHFCLGCMINLICNRND